MISKIRPGLAGRYGMAGLCLLTLCMSQTGCKEQNPEANIPLSHPELIAKVGTIEITRSEFVAEMMRQGVRRDAESLQALLDAMIDLRAAELQADNYKLQQQPDYARQLRKLAYNQIKSAIEAESPDLVTISEEELTEYYNSHQQEFVKPARVRVALIKLSARYGSDASTVKSKAHDLWEQLLTTDGNDRSRLFSQLAESHSDHRASRYRGGDVGYIHQDGTSQWPDELIEQAFAINPGEQALVGVAAGDWYIISALERIEQVLPALEEVRPRIRYLLAQQKQHAFAEVLSEKLRQGLNIQPTEVKLAEFIDHDQSREQQHRIPGPGLN